MTRKVCIMGLGYIGLPTAAVLANRGYSVHGVDVIENIVKTINEGRVHIKEPELDTFVRSAVQSGKLIADVKPVKADIFIIAVPTPFREVHVPNIDYVLQATKAIAPYLEMDNLIIIESTSPIGTSQEVRKVLESKGIDTATISIAYCPERVLPGKIIKEIIENDRIVGGLDEQSAVKAADFYADFVEGKIFMTDDKTAEMVKLVENAYRDVNIAFANELSILADKFGINIWDVCHLANRHPRVNILQPGCGVGGHCIAVDPWFIVHSGGQDANLIKTARLRNNEKTIWVMEKIRKTSREFKEIHDKDAKIAFMGLSYKPDVDDLRGSPALKIVQEFGQENLQIFPVEPNLVEIEGIQLYDCNAAVEIADILVFLVAHKEFRKLDVTGKIVLDFCGVMN